MILYAYRFSYNFYGLISVSGLCVNDDDENFFIGCCKYLQRAYAEFTYVKYSYFIDFRGEGGRDGSERPDTKRTANDKSLKVFAKV